MSTEIEEKKSIADLENTRKIQNSDLLILSRVYGALGNYHSYNINIETFLSTALSDYNNIKDWVWNMINNLSSKVIDEKFVHKVIDEEGLYRYESIAGGKIFNEVPSCQVNPQFNDDLVRFGYLTSYTSSHISASTNNAGEVLYFTGEGSKTITKRINEKILVCDSEDEVNRCKTEKTGNVVDIQNRKVYEYKGGTWKTLSEDPISYIKPGRMAYNYITKKLFFNDGTEIYPIGTETDLSPIYQILQGQLTYLNQIV